MATVADLVPSVLEMLEEDRNNPKFWSIQDEIRPFIVEMLNELTLITGEPQVRNTSPTTLVANQTLQSMPSGSLALLKVEGPGTSWVPKTTMWHLDMLVPGWESQTGTELKYWFPFGLDQWGVYPKLSSPVDVVLTFVKQPTVAARPYTGAETIPFQDEYLAGIEDGAAHIARLKEGGIDFTQSMAKYDSFIQNAVRLSSFALRKGSLRFTRSRGAPARVTEVEVR